MLSECRELPLLEVLPRYQKMFGHARFVAGSAPSDSGGDLPQAIWPLRDSPNLDWTAPDGDSYHITVAIFVSLNTNFLVVNLSLNSMDFVM